MNWPIQDCWYHRSLTPQAVFSGAVPDAEQASRVVIIGAGFAGLATALGLLERGCRDISIVEAQTVGYGASGRNGGFIMAGYSLPESRLINRLGEPLARELYQLTLRAQQTIKRRIREYQWDCELVDEGIVLADWFNNQAGLRVRQQFMNGRMGARWQMLAAGELPAYVSSRRYGGGLLEPDGAHFNPLKYVHALAGYLQANGVRIFEHSRAVAIQPGPRGWSVTVNSQDRQCRLSAEQVVICAGGYIQEQGQDQGLRVSQARAVLPVATYVMVTEPLGAALRQCLPAQAAIYDNRFAFDYYRAMADDRLMWGGRIAIARPAPDRIAQWLKRDMLKVFPELAEARINSAWGGLMGYTRSQMPSISQTQPGLWHALGFGGHGVCATTVAGEIVAAAISQEGRQQRLFEPFEMAPVYGWLGLLAAQGYYWWRQLRDVLRL